MSGSLALAERDPRGRFAPVPFEVRLWAKIAGPWNTAGVRDDDCWYFGGRAKNRWGYPRIWWPDADGRLMLGAHVAAYVVTFGPVPDGLEVCHRCHHKCCCNPSHLYAGTHSENIRHTWERGRTHRRSSAT